jgi:hypothetical protein
MIQFLPCGNDSKFAIVYPGDSKVDVVIPGRILTVSNRFLTFLNSKNAK